MQEYDVHDPDAEAPAWKRHDWTGEEAQFAAQVLQHGDVGRAYATAYRPGERTHRAKCLIEGEKIMQMPFMREYVAHVRDMVKNRLDVTRDRILEELAALAYSNMTDFIVIDEDGNTRTDLSGLTREQLAALQEVTVDTYMEGRGEDAIAVKSVKIKLAPKIGALELLGKHQKMWTDVLEHNDLTEIGDVIAKRRQERRKRKQQGEGHADDGSADSDDASEGGGDDGE